MDVKGFLTELKQQRWYGDQIVHTCHLPARVAEYAVPFTALADELTAALSGSIHTKSRHLIVSGKVRMW